MSQIGTVVSTTETPPAITAPYDTGNCFLVGLADWGPVAKPVTISSLASAVDVVGPRSGTNTTLYDSLDVYFREGGQTAILSRVAGPAASAASLTLAGTGGSAALIVSAVYVGNYGNALQISVNATGGSYTLTLTDTYGNTLAVSPSLSSQAAAVAWAETIGYIDIVAVISAAGNPTTIIPTALAGGTDDRAHVTITQWTGALAAFPLTLGPGQVIAPGVTNTSVGGIWSALASHAESNNRVAIGDMDDGVQASILVSDLGNSFNSIGVGPIGFWAGNLSAPGVVPNTIRSIPPSPVIAALCARVDAAGNPNLAAAGSGFPLQYCTGSYTLVTGVTETYSSTDVSALNNAGINTFATRFGVFENFGFVSSILPTTDAIYWQFDHARLRMALVADTQIVAEPFLFSQLDGQGSDILLFASALTNMLNGYYTEGALYGSTSSDAFSVNTSSSVNTPQTLQNGELNAVLSVRMSPFAQLIDVVINSVSITQSVPTGSAATSTS